MHQDGLVHISQIGDRFVKDPREAVNPGDRVQVRVLKVDLAKKQISLTMKTAASAERRAAEGPREAPAARGPAGAKKPTAPREPRPAGAGKPPASRPDAVPPASSARGRQRSPAGAAPGARPPERRAAFGERVAQERTSAGERGSRRPSPVEAPRTKAPAFNNPFAVLANLKDDKKKGG